MSFRKRNIDSICSDVSSESTEDMHSQYGEVKRHRAPWAHTSIQQERGADGFQRAKCRAVRNGSSRITETNRSSKDIEMIQIALKSRNRTALEVVFKSTAHDVIFFLSKIAFEKDITGASFDYFMCCARIPIPYLERGDIEFVMRAVNKPLNVQGARYFIGRLIGLTAADKLRKQPFRPLVSREAMFIKNHKALIIDRHREMRVRYTEFVSFAIDKNGTRVIDDAISFHASGRVLIHIADPTRWLDHTNAKEILREALERSSSHEVDKFIIPMLPREVTESSSLDRHHVEHALTFSFLAMEGKITSPRIEASIIGYVKKLSYTEASRILQDENEENHSALKNLEHISNSLWLHRDGGRTDEHYIAHRNNHRAACMIEEFMIAAGVIGASTALQKMLPIIYRVKGVRGKAHYTLECGRQSKMNLDAYAPVTSPLRRAVDLVTHFQLKENILKARPFFDKAEMINILETISRRLDDIECSIRPRPLPSWARKDVRRSWSNLRK